MLRNPHLTTPSGLDSSPLCEALLSLHRSSWDYLKVAIVTKLFISSIQVSVPISTPSNLNSHTSSCAKHETCEQDKSLCRCFLVRPVDWIRSYINCFAWLLIVITFRPRKL